ncbi:MAG: ribosome hibernation-promoting factor, HPF/YfiA family [Candidatus Sumerlaeaceae bacterium]|jgi:putative sigma-54 modulation protein
MSVRITSRHFDLTPEVQQYVEKKLSRLKRYIENAQSVEVLIERDRYEHKVELMVKDGPVSITAKTKDPKLLPAIDALMDKAERQLKKKWEKVRGATKKQKAKGSPKKAAAVGVVTESAEEEAEEEEAETESASVAVATRKRATSKRRAMPLEIEKLGLLVFPPEELEVPTLSIDDAAFELFFEDEHFLCFRDEESEDLCIIYRRKDGNLGILKPVIG